MTIWCYWQNETTSLVTQIPGAILFLLQGLLYNSNSFKDYPIQLSCRTPMSNLQQFESTPCMRFQSSCPDYQNMYWSPLKWVLSHCHQNCKKTLLKLQKLHDKNQDAVIYYLSGSLPGQAILHLRQLYLVGMISHLEGDILHEHTINILTTVKPSSTSWFIWLSDTCLQYGFPQPRPPQSENVPARGIWPKCAFP